MTLIIDPKAFGELKEAMGADFIGELIDAYLEETPQLLAELRQALSNQDAEAFRRAAHSLKSTSASFGALTLAAQARELELIAKSGELAAAGDKIDNLGAAYAQAAHALQELKDEP